MAAGTVIQVESDAQYAQEVSKAGTKVHILISH